MAWICDRCFDVAKEDESTEIHVERDGVSYAWVFHNRHDHDCLAIELEQLCILDIQPAAPTIE